MTPAVPLSRRCFVTIGATAGFRQLLAEIIQPEFLQCLSRHGFDELDVQCGPDHPWFEEHTKTLNDTQTYGIQIRSFEYTKNMQEHMLACRSQPGVRQAGCVISHAGSGTILEALRYEVPLVVVPNPTLMDNHQAELAEECEAQKWAVYGRLGKLPDAISRSQELVVQSGLNDLAPYSPPPFPVPESERVTLFDWMVLTCYPEELAKQQHLRDLRSVAENFQHEQASTGQGIKDHGKLLFD
ncbi:glycosyltransferase family 28 C-terminal domain-containing protein [Podospora appendiculata]|uniref:UDP-N-acetylglucosamine transferase subunit ALG13 n=1 Tax=Podospora appendiculata TaxID=314037 RepID=A0AAE1C7U1_9PEZI|nr:glycosyltransferase family 28 C-terminal domain-containing protein [Podospora appendiculata]